MVQVSKFLGAATFISTGGSDKRTPGRSCNNGGCVTLDPYKYGLSRILTGSGGGDIMALRPQLGM